MSDAEVLERELLQHAADATAAEARALERLAAFAASRAWQGHGIRSFGHWCDINLGIASGRAARIAEAAERLAELPCLREAFAEGSISLDKVLLVAPVAVGPKLDHELTAIARTASATQLQRITAAYRKARRRNDSEAAERRKHRRGFRYERDDDGLVRIIALLDEEEGAIVLAAVDQRAEENWRRDREADDDLPRRELADRRADAFVEAMTDAFVSGPDPVVRGERIEVRVNVDAAVLTGEAEAGVCEIEGLGAVSPALVRRLACDARLCTVREDLPGIFDLGRTQRLPSRRQRRALNRRDGGCRFPGCPMRRYVDAHHVLPWEDDGPTDMDNLVLLCARHHTLFHEGGYRIEAHGRTATAGSPSTGPVASPSPAHRAEPGPTPPHRRRAIRGQPKAALPTTSASPSTPCCTSTPAPELLGRAPYRGPGQNQEEQACIGRSGCTGRCSPPLRAPSTEAAPQGDGRGVPPHPSRSGIIRSCAPSQPPSWPSALQPVVTLRRTNQLADLRPAGSGSSWRRVPRD